MKFTDGRHPREGVVSLEHIYPDQDRLEELFNLVCSVSNDCHFGAPTIRSLVLRFWAPIGTMI